MTDPMTPGEQDNSLQQQAPTGFVEKARFDGLVRKVEQLTISERTKGDELALKTSELEHLKIQLGIKDGEKSAAVSQRDQQIAEMLASKQSIDSELSELRSMKTKLKVARELGRPDLVDVLDAIPNLADEEALKAVFSTFTNYADKAVKQREKEIFSGVTPSVSAAQSTAQVPASKDAWQTFINSKPLGSAERLAAQDNYWDWLTAQNS